MTSQIDFHGVATDFIPADPVELRGIHLSIFSDFDCALLCHQDPQCRTFVFDSPVCRLYEGSSNTGSIVISSSASSVVGAINYDNINLVSAYNKSCDHCYPDRYLVCTNSTCQCPLNTFWDGNSKCLNQVFVGSTLTCQSDDWCRQDLNLTCRCGNCQCPVQTFWRNKTCEPQLLMGMQCNTSDQCRNDLNLTCSRTNKTCTLMPLVKISVVNGTLPAQFSNLGIVLNSTGYEWWRAFDGNPQTFWNSASGAVPEYLLLTFSDEYLLNYLQMTVYDDYWHDPKTMDVYLDQDATCMGDSFSFPWVQNATYFTLPPSPFNTANQPLATKQLLLAIVRWSGNQVWLCELAFYGRLY